jgi:hypothetical protein
MTNKYMKLCSTFLAIRETQMKTTSCQEVEIRRIEVRGQPGQTVHEALSQKKKKPNAKQGWQSDRAPAKQVWALNSNPSITNIKKK